MGTKEEVSVQWAGKMAFKTSVNGHEFMLDANESVGGEDKGPRPKPLMLTALAGCTAMDIVSILKKMRVEFDDLQVRVQGDLTDEHPKHFNKMHVIYEFKGKNLPKDKLQKAIDLSEERYCGVSAVYKKAMEVSSEMIIIE